MSVAAKPWLPNKDQLFGDLSIFRRLLDQSGERFFKVKTLQRTAQFLCPRKRDAESINDAIKLAINRLGANESAEAAAELYGLTPQSRGQPLPVRWERAADCVNASSVDAFRTGQGEEIIGALAGALIELLNEHSDTEDQLNEAPTTLLTDGYIDGSQAQTAIFQPVDEWLLPAEEVFDNSYSDTENQSSEVLASPTLARGMRNKRRTPRRRRKLTLGALLTDLEDYLKGLEEEHVLSKGMSLTIFAAITVLLPLLVVVGIIWIVYLPS